MITRNVLQWNSTELWISEMQTPRFSRCCSHVWIAFPLTAMQKKTKKKTTIQYLYLFSSSAALSLLVSQLFPQAAQLCLIQGSYALQVGICHVSQSSLLFLQFLSTFLAKFLCVLTELVLHCFQLKNWIIIMITTM